MASRWAIAASELEVMSLAECLSVIPEG
jgi:hypothetical protein